MRRGYLTVYAVILCGWAVADGQQIQFEAVPDEVLKERLGRVKRDNGERAAEMARMFEQAGCRGERLALEPAGKKRPPNVVCTLPGKGTATVVVGAHHDAVRESGTGSVDNWSGASMLASLYESLSKKDRTITFVFAGFAEEETGLNGSRAFLKAWKKAGRRMPDAMVNLDSVGMAETRYSPEATNKRLAAALGATARAMRLPLSATDVSAVGMSDGQSFSQEKIPIVDIHSLTQQNYPTLHSLRDNESAVVFERYRETYRLVAGMLSLLDWMQSQAAGRGEGGGI